MGKHFRKWKVWSEAELNFLRLQHKDKSPSSVCLVDLAEELGRPYDDVKSRCSLLGLRRKDGCIVVKDRDEAYMRSLRERDFV